MSKYKKYFEKSDWKKCEKLIKISLKNDIESFFEWTMLSAVVYEQKRYKEARIYSKIALSLNPESPLVWWDYAGVLYMLDEESKAISYWEKIIGLGVQEIGKVRTREGKKWARSLITDSHFRLGKTYFEIQKMEKASKHLRIFVKNLEKGYKSLYSKSDAKKLLKKISKTGNKA